MCRLFPTSTPLADRNAEDTRSDILCPCHLQMIFLLAFQLSFNWTFTSALKAQTLIHNCEQPKQGRWGKGWVRFVSGRWLKMRLEATFGRVRCIVRWRAPTFWRHCILWCKWCSPRLKCLVTLMGLFRPLSGSACSSCGCLGGEEVWARCSGSGVAMRGAGLFFTQMVNKAIPLAEKLEKKSKLNQKSPTHLKDAAIAAKNLCAGQFADIVPVVCALLPATFNLHGVCFIVALLAEVCLLRVCPDRPTPYNLGEPLRHTTRATFQLSRCRAWLLFAYSR